MRRKNYPGTLSRRGDAFWWRWQVNGRRVSRTFHTRDRAEALRLLRQAMPEVEAETARVRKGLRVDAAMSDLLTEFERDYLPGLAPGSQRACRGSLALFRTFFVDNGGDPLVARVRKSDIAAYFDWRRTQPGISGDAPISQRTLRKDYAALHKLFAWAVDHREWCAANPVSRMIKPQRGDERQAIILSEAQIETLITACDKRPMLKLFVTLCAETGVRPNSEALWLRWEDIDLARGTLTIVSGRDGHRTKTGKTRALPLSARLVAALRDHMATYQLKNDSPWVFHHPWARRRAKAGQRIGTLLHAFQNAATRAKLPAGLRPYDLRHTRITRWVAAGHNMALIQKAAGHASVRTTMGYVHLVDDDLSVLVERPARVADPDSKFVAA